MCVCVQVCFVHAGVYGFTVEPPKRGQFGSRGFVLCSEVVPISEVHNYIAFLLHIQ